MFLFEHLGPVVYKSALAYPSTSPCTYTLPVCSCFTDLSNPATALTFVPAERSKNCESDHDRTFLQCPKKTKVMVFSNSDVIMTV